MEGGGQNCAAEGGEERAEGRCRFHGSGFARVEFSVLSKERGLLMRGR
jgi:hypothetical protein